LLVSSNIAALSILNSSILFSASVIVISSMPSIVTSLPPIRVGYLVT
jgi:hypothetical protein